MTKPNKIPFPTLFFLIMFQLIFSLCCTIPAFAQTEIVPNTNAIEDIIEQTGEESEFEYDTQFEQLALYLKEPLNFNQATENDLSNFGLLSVLQIQALLDYRETIGAFITIYEIQAIPNFDLITIQKILPYITINKGLDDYNISIKEQLTKGKHHLFTRFRQILEPKAGYQSDDTESASYLGNPQQYYLRYRYRFNNKLSYGITMEKDAGEEFFQGSNRLGFDYYSAHFYTKNINSTLKAVALGDFEARFGQGLVIWSGFGFGKGAYVTNIKRTGSSIKAYSSVNETNFLRGAGAVLALNENIELTLFSSIRQRDANILAIDTTDTEPTILEVSALQITGLHRTVGEIEDKNAIQQWTSGLQLKYSNRAGHFAINTVYHQLNAPLQVSDQLYNQYRFRGDYLLNGSIDYSYGFRNFHFFGETAWSDNNALATTNGVLIGLDRSVDLALLYRNFERDFHTLSGNTFSETSSISNEEGMYLGLSIHPNRRWNLSIYYDAWQHPWLRFGIDAPSVGQEYLIQLEHRPTKKTQVSARFRQEVKEVNAVGNQTPSDFLVAQTRTQGRLHFSTQLTDRITLRSRIEISQFKRGDNPIKNGFLVYQDFLYKKGNWQFSTRYALFDTDDFDTRIYAYESDLRFAFSIPAYYYKGNRFYLNIKYRLPKNITLEVRFAQTRLINQNTLGSGLETIEGNTRTEVKCQLQWKF